MFSVVVLEGNIRGGRTYREDVGLGLSVCWTQASPGSQSAVLIDELGLDVMVWTTST